MQNKIKQQKLVFLGILMLVLLSYPFITVANRAALAGGFPVLYLNIFTVWIIAIIANYRVTDNKKKKSQDE